MPMSASYVLLLLLSCAPSMLLSATVCAQASAVLHARPACDLFQSTLRHPWQFKAKWFRLAIFLWKCSPGTCTRGRVLTAVASLGAFATSAMPSIVSPRTNGQTGSSRLCVPHVTTATTPVTFVADYVGLRRLRGRTSDWGAIGR